MGRGDQLSFTSTKSGGWVEKALAMEGHNRFLG